MQETDVYPGVKEKKHLSNKEGFGILTGRFYINKRPSVAW